MSQLLCVRTSKLADNSRGNKGRLRAQLPRLHYVLLMPITRCPVYSIAFQWCPFDLPLPCRLIKHIFIYWASVFFFSFTSNSSAARSWNEKKPIANHHAAARLLMHERMLELRPASRACCVCLCKMRHAKRRARSQSAGTRKSSSQASGRNKSISVAYFSALCIRRKMEHFI